MVESGEQPKGQPEKESLIKLAPDGLNEANQKVRAELGPDLATLVEEVSGPFDNTVSRALFSQSKAVKRKDK